MSVRQYANAPATALANSCTSLATSIEVESVTGLPITYPYTLIIDRGTASEEAVEVTAAAGTTLTVTRGIDSTTAFAHSSGAEVVHGITARDLAEPNAHINTDSGVHGVTGDLVGTTDAQTLTNKTLTSPTISNANLTGNPVAPTPAATDNDTSVATTAFVRSFLAKETIGVAADQIVLNTTNVAVSGEGVYAERSGLVVTLHVYVQALTGSNPILTMPDGWRPVSTTRDILTPTTTTARAVLIGTDGVLTSESGVPALLFGTITYICNRT